MTNPNNPTDSELVDFSPGLAPPPGGVDYGSDEIRKRVRGARIALMFVGVLSLGFLVFQTVQLFDELDRYGLSFSDLPAVSYLLFALGYAGALTYIVLSFVAKTRPYGASLAGLIIYLVDVALGGMLEPETLYKGIVIKVIIIVVLARAVKAGLDYRNHRRTSKIDQVFS